MLTPERAGRKANGAINLVVDELLKCELLNGKRYASMTAAVLQTLSTSMANAIRVVVSSLTPELSGLTKSGSERLFVPLYLPQLSPLVKLVPGHLDQSYRKVTVEAVQRLLDDLAYQSLLQDTAGVPRLMEVVYWHAAERLLAESPHAVKRESILDAVVKHGRLSQAYGDGALIVQALETTFIGWRAEVQRELGHARANLVRTGYLHLAQPSASNPRLFEDFALQLTIIPPLLFYVWCQHPGVCRHPLLRAVLNFLYWDDPTTYSGESFERQLVALWRQLSVADWIWRRSPAIHGQPKGCLRSAVAGVPSTLHGMLGCDKYPGATVADSTSSRRPLQDYPDGVYPVDDGRFATGAAIRSLPIGLSIPEQPNHPGFDFLDVRLTADGSHRFYTVVEAKFTSGVTYIHGKDVADKLVLALTTYPGLLAALREGLFCFVLATFQLLADVAYPFVHRQAGARGAEQRQRRRDACCPPKSNSRRRWSCCVGRTWRCC